MRKRIHARVTRLKLIPNINSFQKEFLDIPKEHTAMGIITSNVENVMYSALDYASKNARIHIAYSSAAYSGSKNLWAQIRGQVIGILSGPNVTDVKRGLGYARDFIEKEARLYSFDEDESMMCYVHLIPRIGRYYEDHYHIPRGMAAVHLVSSPMESTFALDRALKAGKTKIAEFFEIPTKANNGGAILYGSYSACRAAGEAFIDAVEYCFSHPMDVE